MLYPKKCVLCVVKIDRDFEIFANFVVGNDWPHTLAPEATAIVGVAHAAPDTTRTHVHAYVNAAELLESSRSGSNDDEASSVTPAAARLA